MSLRPYQAQAVSAAIEWVKTSIEPCLIEAATGSGKSHIIAAIAKVLNEISGGKHVLCVAPSAELVSQNREKYLATGNPASVYSASAGAKCLRNPVVFATPGTFKKVAKRLGARFCAVVVDEAHGMTPTIKTIIDDMRESSPNLRVIGLSATPYRLGEGYIYRQDETGKTHGPDTAKCPYFAQRIFNITAKELLEMGYLTPPTIGEIGTESYDTLHLELNSRGQFDSADIDRAFIGHGRKTAMIVADVVRRSKGREGVMIFAATVQHAEEVMASLPPGISAIVTGGTPKKERESILHRFKANRIRYLVNVSVLTTGFDAPHVSVIALLRATESVALLQQIIGRGMRLHESKKDFLVLDYAENLDRHCPDGDIFNPQIRASMGGEDLGTIEVECPECSTKLDFKLRPMEGLFDIDKHGYYTLEGQQVMTDHGPQPAHYGRRCYGLIKSAGGTFEQCGYRWTFKPCPLCENENDIAARYCKECRAELIDPNEKLVIEFKQLKRDPTRTQTDEVLYMDVVEGISRAGNRTIRVDFETPYRRFSIWYTPHNRPKEYQKFLDATEGGVQPPETVTYRKEESGFFRVLAYGLEPDLLPEFA